MREAAVTAGVVNFVITGELRAGTALLASALGGLAGAVCHMNLMHDDDEVRRACHEEYFGPSRDPRKLPGWFVPGDTNPWQYLNSRVFDNPLRGESAVGARLTYGSVRRHELHELFRRRAEEGDFCVVHVVRNPVSCFVSARQAEAGGIWARAAPRDDDPIPTRVQVEPAELTAFVRDWVSVKGKVVRSCVSPKSHLAVDYRSLVFSYDRAVRRVADFVGVPVPPSLLRPPTARLANRSMRERISDFWGLRKSSPPDVREFLDADDLF